VLQVYNGRALIDVKVGNGQASVGVEPDGISGVVMEIKSRA
jgi:hypothetical protein